jgi:hypothetical protein
MQIEILALRHRLAVLQRRTPKRPAGRFIGSLRPECLDHIIVFN